MKYKTIGKSGLITSTLTLGTMIFGEHSDRATPKKEALKIIDHYLGQGGNHLDTADVYAEGRSEEIVGESVKTRRQEVILSTKVRFSTGNHVNAEGLSRLHITEGVHASLKRMGTDYLDLLYVHCFDPLTPLEETIQALQDLIRSGKVRYIGISNFKAWQAMKAQGLTRELTGNCFIAGQYQYSLVKRDLEYEFSDFFVSEGIGLVPWGPLGGGFLTGKYAKGRQGSGRISTTPQGSEESWERRDSEKNWRILEQVNTLAEKYNVTRSQISLAWILSKSMVSSVILGVRTMEQLQDNMLAHDLRLSEEDLLALDQVSQLPELYPYRLIEEYGERVL